MPTAKRIALRRGLFNYFIQINHCFVSYLVAIMEPKKLTRMKLNLSRMVGEMKAICQLRMDIENLSKLEALLGEYKARFHGFREHSDNTMDSIEDEQQMLPIAREVGSYRNHLVT